MNDLRELIRGSRVSKKELVGTSVRLTKETHSFIEGLAEQLSLTKQETIVQLIEEGRRIAEAELRLDEPDDGNEIKNSKYILLNTNKRNDTDDEKTMLEWKIAAAYYGKWKWEIDKLNKGDMIFLYSNGKGIIAYGEATGDTLVENKYGDEGECHYQYLNKFMELDKPISAQKIRDTLGYQVVFMKTMIPLSHGEKLLNEISNN